MTQTGTVLNENTTCTDDVYVLHITYFLAMTLSGNTNATRVCFTLQSPCDPIHPKPPQEVV